jgi:hypothetical protein
VTETNAIKVLRAIREFWRKYPTIALSPNSRLLRSDISLENEVKAALGEGINDKAEGRD